MRCQLSSALVAAAYMAKEAVAGPFIHDVSLGEHYPYAVALPVDNSEALPPALVFLGGTGSMFQQGETQDRDTVVSFGGPGWNIVKYDNGSTDDADALAAEQFVTVIPYQYLYETDDEDKASYHWQSIQEVVEDARSKYPFDPNRIHLSGYSMGARAMWHILMQSPDYYASAAVVSGTTYPNMTGLEGLTEIPLRQYAGELDYEAVSQVYQHQEVEDYLEDHGDTVSQLIVFNNTHEEMQQVAFDADYYSWTLSQVKDSSPASQEAATSSDAERQEAYSSDYASWSSWSSENSFSLYALGFPTESRPSEPTGADSADQEDDDSSAAVRLPSAASGALAFLLSYMTLFWA